MPDQFKVGVSNPVTDSSLGSSEEVIKDSNFVSEEHQPVNQMGAHKSSATSYENALSGRRGKELHRRETGEGSVRDGMTVWVEDRLGLVCR